MSQSYGALQTSHCHSFLARHLSATHAESHAINQGLLESIEISWRLFGEQGWSSGPKSTSCCTRLQVELVLQRKVRYLRTGRDRHKCWERTTSRSKWLWRWCFACWSTWSLFPSRGYWLLRASIWGNRLLKWKQWRGRRRGNQPRPMRVYQLGHISI